MDAGYGPEQVMPDMDERALSAVRQLNQIIAELREQVQELNRALENQRKMHDNFVQALITETEALNINKANYASTKIIGRNHD